MQLHLSRSTSIALLCVCSATLLGHALSYGFVCDDAFIAFRYSKHLAEHGFAVYNLGEYVEGYTSPAWMFIGAIGGWLGWAIPSWMQIVGALCGIILTVGVWILSRQLLGRANWMALVVPVALVLFASVAAWSMGGLETPLYAALIVWSFVLCDRVITQPTLGRAASLGLILALCTFARPEGALLFAIVWVVLLWAWCKTRAGWRALSALSATYVVVVGAHVSWRLWYYGEWLPNTFYAKTAGSTAESWKRGLGYSELAAWEIGVWWLALCALALLLPVWKRGERPESARVLQWMCRLWMPSTVLYVIAVGGDFLDLYRFYVPLLPLVVLWSAVLLTIIWERLPRKVGLIGALVTIGLLGLHGSWQFALRARALQISEPSRQVRQIEPLGWTKLYGQRWSATGRWLATAAESNDWMTTTAAGAMPFFAGISNLDQFGLCDAYVARHGHVVSSRPGHERFAPWPYVLARRPAFIVFAEQISETPQPLTRDTYWERLGYTLAEVAITPGTYEAPGTFYQRLLLRQDRALKLAGHANVRFAPTL